MRKIKFRAWDKINKKLISGNKFSINGITGKIDAVTWKDWEYSENPDDFILMQFTGLHDKNGKEIYEGDIVKFHPYRYEIIWDKNGVWKYGEGGYLYEQESNEMKVIGNIYENPELLE